MIGKELGCIFIRNFKFLHSGKVRKPFKTNTTSSCLQDLVWSDQIYFQ